MPLDRSSRFAVLVFAPSLKMRDDRQSAERCAKAGDNKIFGRAFRDFAFAVTIHRLLD